MANITRHSLVLVPTALEVVEEFSAYTRAVFGNCDSPYLCGVHSHPHISVGQFEIEGGGIEGLIHILKPFENCSFTLRLRDIYFSPGSTAVWCGFGVLFNQALHDFIINVAAAVNAAGFSIRNAHGLAYWPHVTAARLTDMKPVNYDALINTNFFDREFEFISTQGASGEQWQFLKSV